MAENEQQDVSRSRKNAFIWWMGYINSLLILFYTQPVQEFVILISEINLSVAEKCWEMWSKLCVVNSNTIGVWPALQPFYSADRNLWIMFQSYPCFCRWEWDPSAWKCDKSYQIQSFSFVQKTKGKTDRLAQCKFQTAELFGVEWTFRKSPQVCV